MPLRVQCSAGHLMMVPDHRAGTTLRCPNCGIDVQVPAAVGTTGKELATPRILTPSISRSDPKLGGTAATRQSPQVAGHSTAASSGIGLPTLGKKPTLAPRTKPPPLPAAAKQRTGPEQFEPKPPPEKPTLEKSPAEVPEVVFTSPVIVAPRPIVEPPPPLVINQADVETVAAPPKKIPPAKAALPVSNRPRATLTGTMLSPAPEPDVVFVAPPVQEPILVIAAVPEPPSQPALHAAATEVDPVPPPKTLLRGVQPTSSQRFTAWQLATALIAAAVLSIGPAVWEIVDYSGSDGLHPVARWAFLLLMLGVVQIGCIALLVQVPDWSSVWIVTLQSLALAAIYAAVLGLTIITSGDSPIIEALKIEQQYSSGKAPMWCVCLAATYACLAFFAGRISAKWRKVLRQIQVSEQSAAGHA